jgi:hypothetical protein
MAQLLHQVMVEQVLAILLVELPQHTLAVVLV